MLMMQPTYAVYRKKYHRFGRTTRWLGVHLIRKKPSHTLVTPSLPTGSRICQHRVARMGFSQFGPWENVWAMQFFLSLKNKQQFNV